MLGIIQDLDIYDFTILQIKKKAEGNITDQAEWFKWGVTAEIGYAYALDKKIIGYRSDIRMTGDNIGAKINLQIEYFIYNSKGEIVTNIRDLQETLRKLQRR
jgi:hypothetical protein